jgi:predicted GTPase
MRHVVVYAGIDYERIVREAEKEATIILWDGGNNDFSFYRSDLIVVLADPHRAGHELAYHPGETNVRMADVVVISKVDTARREAVELVRSNVRLLNSKAAIIEAAMPIAVEDPGAITGKHVLVVEDGPTLTHGEMAYGAGYLAAEQFGGQLIDPRPYAVGSIAETYKKYGTIGPVLPAMGYGPRQVQELEETIARTPCDLVLVASPVDLRRLLRIRQPSQRVQYELREIGPVTLLDILKEKFGNAGHVAHEDLASGTPFVSAIDIRL